MAGLNAQFEKFWAQHGEMLVWKLWVQKYPDQVHYHEVAAMPAVQEVEVGGEGDREEESGAVTPEKGHEGEEGGNAGDDGNSSDCNDVVVAGTSVQQTLATSEQRMDASGDAHVDAPSLRSDVSRLGSLVDASGDASSTWHGNEVRDLSDSLHPCGDTSQSSVPHFGVLGETSESISAEPHSQGMDTAPLFVDEVCVGDVEDSSQPCPGKEFGSDRTSAEVAVGDESDKGNTPATHLTGFNLAIQNTMNRVREESSPGATQDEGRDNCVDGDTGPAVAGEGTSRVHMMHSYASCEGGLRGEHGPDQKHGEDGTGGHSDSDLVRKFVLL